MKVRAIKTGYYAGKRRDPDTTDAEFILTDARHFSKNWMAPIGWTPGGDPLDHDGDGKKGGAKNTDTGLAGMTVEQLRALAVERGVDLTDLKKKADIIAAIELATDGENSDGAHDSGGAGGGDHDEGNGDI